MRIHSRTAILQDTLFLMLHLQIQIRSIHLTQLNRRCYLANEIAHTESSLKNTGVCSYRLAFGTIHLNLWTSSSEMTLLTLMLTFLKFDRMNEYAPLTPALVTKEILSCRKISVLFNRFTYIIVLIQIVGDIYPVWVKYHFDRAAQTLFNYRVVSLWDFHIQGFDVYDYVSGTRKIRIQCCRKWRSHSVHVNQLKSREQNSV